MQTTPSTVPGAPPADDRRPRGRPALSPSRAADFKQCPLLYRFRTVDRLPEQPTKAQVRGTVVHSVLEQLFAAPAAQRLPELAHRLVEPTWQRELAAHPEFGALFEDSDDPAAELRGWLDSAAPLLDAYFAMEDPRYLEPDACEELVEVESGDGVLLRGYIDRLDVAPGGDIRVVDYKTGAAPRLIGEAKAMFQMKFYALVLYRIRGVVPRQLRLMYLTDGQSLAYAPDEPELLRFERTLEAIWAAIKTASVTGDFRPSPSKLCNWCNHQSVCPAYGGTPPPYPGWPEPEALAEAGEQTVSDRAE
ncbi:MAG: RecB family exonuclease [Sciscionella sp.]